MRQLVLVAAILALVLAAASDARRGGSLRLDLETDFEYVESTIVCDPRPFQGGLADAAAILLGGAPPPRWRLVTFHGFVAHEGDRLYCAGATTVSETPGAGRAAQVTVGRTAPKVGAGERGVSIRFDECPYTQATGCSLSRPFVFRIRYAGESKAACRTLSSGASPLARFVAAGGGTWRALKTRGTLSYVRPGELMPALLDRVCGADTPRAQRLGRELGLGGLSQPPASSFQLGAFTTYAHGTRGSNICVYVWTRPGQPPLRGGITLTGPSGQQTKAFTTLGGEAKTRVVFTVAERARYVADVTLAGKTAQTAALLGLAPTTSGEYACPAP